MCSSRPPPPLPCTVVQRGGSHGCHRPAASVRGDGWMMGGGRRRSLLQSCGLRHYPERGATPRVFSFLPSFLSPFPYQRRVSGRLEQRMAELRRRRAQLERLRVLWLRLHRPPGHSRGLWH